MDTKESTNTAIYGTFRKITPVRTPIMQRSEPGEFLHRIAADYDVNPGRICEIKKGYRFRDNAAAD